MAYNVAWSIATPQGSVAANQIDTYIQETKEAVGERLADLIEAWATDATFPKTLKVGIFGAGTVGAPSIAPRTFPDTGLYFPADGDISFACDGVRYAKLTSLGLAVDDIPELTADTGVTVDGATIKDGAAPVNVKKAGVSIGKRRGINFIEGTSIALTVADDGANEEVDVTIAISGSVTTFSGARVSNVNANTVSTATNYNPGFDTEQFDTDSYHAAGTPSRLSIIEANEKYNIGGVIRWDGNASGIRRMTLRNVTGASDIVTIREIGQNADQTQQLHTLEVFTGTDTIELEIHQTSGGDLDIAGGTAERFFYIQKAGQTVP